MSTIPASELVAVNPSVLSAGGDGVDVIGLVLTEGTRVPLGTVASFPNGAAVASYFGAGSVEDKVANGGTGLGSGYFGGFDNSTRKPAAILFAQYNSAAVAAYLRGGNISALSLAALQAIVGSLDIIVDGYPRNASSVNLSAATSFSSAASIIQTALNAADPTEASVTASVGASFTGAISGVTLTVSAVGAGKLSVGDTVLGSGVMAATTITALGSGTGGTGTYTVNNSQTVGSEAMTTTSNVLHVTAVGSGTVVPGEYATGAGFTSAVILSQLSGTTGAAGDYLLAGIPQTVASETFTITGTPVAVTYDSVSGAFVVTSGITGANSLIAFATGTISAALMLSATGAVTSQGAAAAVPAAFMNALLVVTANWVTFMTAFDPDGGSGNTVKQAFSAWKNAQNNRFAYVCGDTDVTPIASVPATGSLGYILANNGDSGTCLLDGQAAAGWDTNAAIGLAAFVCGAAASIDFARKNGRIEFAYKKQAGLAATVTDPTAGQNLGGNPQVAASYGNGYSFYGAYGTASPTFVWFQRGLVTGPFRWLDSYINQIWLNNAFQIAILTLLASATSVPYSTVGDTLIESALADPIQAALNFGAFGPGPLSQTQIAAVNAAAGARISDTLQTQGYYLQILPASAATRSARTSPSCTFWYIDKGSIQAITLASIALT